MLELHTYTLASAEALRQYTTHFWPRHIQSLRKHGITVQGVWIDLTADAHRVIALVHYPPGANPTRLADIYRLSVLHKRPLGLRHVPRYLDAYVNTPTDFEFPTSVG